MKIVIYNLGCKVNQYEADAIANELIEAGHDVSYEFERADVYVINTCAVTSEAERKSRQMASKCLKFNPEAQVYVCGCAAENNSDQFANKKNVVFISGVARKAQLPSMIERLSQSRKDVNCAEIAVEQLPNQYENDMEIRNVRTRAYVKVQDGCNNFCSYCLIPYLRGRSRSRSIDSVYAEAVRLSDKVGEIVLTGINLSAYGKDIGVDLSDLLTTLSDVESRIRLGSLEVGVITERFLKATQRLKAFCPQFHLSLQSGDDDVLKSMNRHYTTSEYAERVRLIREYYPDAAITTDLIIAFPTETEECFVNTLNFIKSINFADMHIFIYSPRSGTKAAALPIIEPTVAKRRESVVKACADKMRNEFLTCLLGKELEVLVENDGSGYSREYARVYCGGNDGDIVTIKPIELFNDGLK